MAGRFVVSISCAKNDTDKATVGFVVANAAVASDKESVVFLSIEGTRLSQQGYAADIHEEGFAPLAELMESFVAAGGQIYVCSPCFKKRGLDEGKLVIGAKVVGGAKLVEFMSEGAPSISYSTRRAMLPVRSMIVAFVAVAIGYVALSFALFKMPETLAAAQDCGFLPGEYISAGNLTYERSQAFLVSFLRKQEYFTALTLGVTAAFLAFALRSGRTKRGMAKAGIAAGGGVIAISALCVSCLAPILSVVGIGVLGSVMAGVPKGLLLLNTVLLTGWGTMYLSRRAASCPMPDGKAA